jgi:small subunit ribosomal protein S15
LATWSCYDLFCDHCCRHAYDNKENIDLSKVPNYKLHVSGRLRAAQAHGSRGVVIGGKAHSDFANARVQAKDCGSAQFQVATLSARVEQIGKHMQANKKDHAAKRGLLAVLAQRKSLLQYVYREDR